MAAPGAVDRRGPRPRRAAKASTIRRWAISTMSRASHVGDELVDALVDRLERILAEYRPLRLIVELQVDPVDGVVAALLLRMPDEVAAQPRTRRLWRIAHGPRDLLLRGDTLDLSAPLEQV